DAVLRAMLSTGALPAAAVQAALAETPRIEPRRANTFLPRHPDADVTGLYFIDAVRQQLIARFGEGAVLRGGLHVYTTLDVRLQKTAEEDIANRLQQLSAQGKTARRAQPVDNPIEGGLVAIDPR